MFSQALQLKSLSTVEGISVDKFMGERKREKLEKHVLYDYLHKSFYLSYSCYFSVCNC